MSRTDTSVTSASCCCRAPCAPPTALPLHVRLSCSSSASIWQFHSAAIFFFFFFSPRLVGLGLHPCKQPSPHRRGLAVGRAEDSSILWLHCRLSRSAAAVGAFKGRVAASGRQCLVPGRCVRGWRVPAPDDAGGQGRHTDERCPPLSASYHPTATYLLSGLLLVADIWRLQRLAQGWPQTRPSESRAGAPLPPRRPPCPCNALFGVYWAGLRAPRG